MDPESISIFFGISFPVNTAQNILRLDYNCDSCVNTLVVTSDTLAAWTVRMSLRTNCLDAVAATAICFCNL